MKKYFLTFMLGVAVFCVSPQVIYASELYFSSPTQHFKTGDEIYFDIFLNNEGESINAIEAELIFPHEILEFSNYFDTGSIVSGWIETPTLNGNSVRLAGIFAGGFSGLIDPVTNTVSSGRVTRLVFKAKRDGKGSLSFATAKTFKNDGIGTTVATSILPYEFLISRDGFAVEDFSYDTNPPEPFEPQIKRDNRLFDGKYFVVFDAKDKETGIASYRIKEGYNRWINIKSLYVLQDQSLTSNIRIVAIDKNGNEREAIINLGKSPISTSGIVIFAGLCVLIIGASVFAYVYTRRKK